MHVAGWGASPSNPWRGSRWDGRMSVRTGSATWRAATQSRSAISWSSLGWFSERPRCCFVSRRGDPRLFREARNRATEDVELRRASGLEVDQEAGLHAGRQAIDYAHHARDLPLGEADTACARDGNDFLDRALQQSPPERIGAQRPDGGAGEPARRRYACKKHELLPQLHLDPIGRAGVHSGVPERPGDPLAPLAGRAVVLADDDDLKGTASLDDARPDANRADRREATDHGAGRHIQLREALQRLHSIQQRHHRRSLLGAAPHDRSDVHKRVALDGEDREIGGGGRHPKTRRRHPESPTTLPPPAVPHATPAPP